MSLVKQVLIFLFILKLIKSHAIAIYNPRNPHICSIKQGTTNSRSSLFNHIDVTFSCKVIQQVTFEIVLAKIGGIEQILVLLARVRIKNKKSALTNFILSSLL